MNIPTTMETSVSLKQAYMTMFEFLEQRWKRLGKPDELCALLSELAIWETESGSMEPMDVSVIPEWIGCADIVCEAEVNADGYHGADILLNSKKPSVKINR